MSDLVPFSKQAEVSITVPQMFYQQMQALAAMLNEAVEDDALYQQGVDALGLIHEQMTYVVETAAAAIQAVIEERDEAFSQLDDAVCEKEAAEEALGELQEAIDDYLFTDNRAIQRMVEQIEEAMYEGVYDTAIDDWESTKKDSMAEYVKRQTGVTTMEAHAFVSALLDEDFVYDKDIVQKVAAALTEKLNEVE